MRNMVKLTTICAALSAALLVGGYAAYPDGPSKLDRMMAASVQVNGDKGRGSGFALTPTLIVTAAHVVDGNSGFVVRDSAGVDHPATVLWQAPGRDTALLQVEAPIPGVAGLACRAPVLDEPITLIGNQTIVRFRVSRGTVASIEPPEFGPEANDEQIYHGTILNIAAGPGDSGAPVFDANGDVLGLLEGGIERGGYPTVWMIPATRICDLVARA